MSGACRVGKAIGSSGFTQYVAHAAAQVRCVVEVLRPVVTHCGAHAVCCWRIVSAISVARGTGSVAAPAGDPESDTDSPDSADSDL